MSDDRDEIPNSDPDSQMLRCVECGQFFPAQDDTDEMVPAGAERGGRCPDCGGGEFEQVVLSTDDHD